jgi:hypothetical protein
MTGMDKGIKRRTVNPYRIGISGSWIDQGGKKLVVELEGDERGDFVRIREEGRKASSSVVFDVGELYRKGLIAKSAQDKKRKGA